MPGAGTDLDSVVGSATGRQRPLRNGTNKTVTIMWAVVVRERDVRINVK